MRVGAHPTCPGRGELCELVHECAGCIEELLRSIAPQPRIQLPEVGGAVPHVREGHLVATPRVLHGFAVHDLRTGPPLRRAQDDHWPLRTMTARRVTSRGRLD